MRETLKLAKKLKLAGQLSRIAVTKQLGRPAHKPTPTLVKPAQDKPFKDPS